MIDALAVWLADQEQPSRASVQASGLARQPTPDFRARSSVHFMGCFVGASARLMAFSASAVASSRVLPLPGDLEAVDRRGPLPYVPLDPLHEAVFDPRYSI
jgi:hypothetical protein